MALFLSKLLPLLIYPIGLVSLLLVLALLLVWRHPRWTAATLLVALLALVVPSSPWAAQNLAQSLEQRYAALPPLPEADAIVVLGGALRPQQPPRPWIDVMESGDRVLHGVRLYQAGKAPKLIFSGGRIDWNGKGKSEAADMAVLATAMGVPEGEILQEQESLNTRQNALKVQQLLNQNNMDQILLVTSATHMPRALAVFRHLGIAASPAPTDFLTTTAGGNPDSPEGKILNLLPNAESLYRFTQAMKEYVGLAIYKLRGWA
ncbi:MAG: YdcF family protein [Cyanobacteria bacterium P01_A01_bin.135]